ncbi:hypothetical protein EDD85DRAFT_948446 [Armillaria nabsnona]|nr:hypothetical protein EDD85DRAFT_948446 [Armillaria nabsnona]
MTTAPSSTPSLAIFADTIDVGLFFDLVSTLARSKLFQVLDAVVQSPVLGASPASCATMLSASNDNIGHELTRGIYKALSGSYAESMGRRSSNQQQRSWLYLRRWGARKSNETCTPETWTPVSVPVTANKRSFGKRTLTSRCSRPRKTQRCVSRELAGMTYQYRGEPLPSQSQIPGRLTISNVCEGKAMLIGRLISRGGLVIERLLGRVWSKHVGLPIPRKYSAYLTEDEGAPLNAVCAQGLADAPTG